MSIDAPTFNLVNEPWIVVVDEKGREELRSLSNLSSDLHRFSRFGGEIALQSFAILRLYLAILHRSLADSTTGLPGPADLSEWEHCVEDWDSVSFAIDKYLDRWRHRFDLLHPTEPFYQVADLNTAKGAVGSLEAIIADVPTGHKYMTNRLGASLEKISRAEAARWLVTVHAFDVSGIHSGALGDPRVKAGKGYGIGTGWCGKLGGLHLNGRNLRETVLLNAVAFSEVDIEPRLDDLPTWERPPLDAAVEAEDRQPRGPIELYTWQSRRVRLVDDGRAIVGSLVCQGDPVDEANRMKIEPMTAWYYSKPQSDKRKMDIYRPKSHDPERAIWRGIEALLPAAKVARGGADVPRYLAPAVLEWAAYVARYGTDIVYDATCMLRAVGVQYGSQQAVMDEMFDDEVVLPWKLLAEDSTPTLTSLVLAAVDATDSAVGSLGGLAVNLAEAGGLDPEMSAPLRDRTTAQAYGLLDIAFRSWLSGLTSDGEVATSRAAWRDTARTILMQAADAQIRQCAPACWVGRNVRGSWLDAATAERWFRTAINKALPMDGVMEKGTEDGES